MGAGVAVHLPVNLHGFSVREEDRENYSTRRDYIVKKKKKVGHAVVRMEGKKIQENVRRCDNKHAEEEKGVMQVYSYLRN